jgi:hypothetical protein
MIFSLPAALSCYCSRPQCPFEIEKEVEALWNKITSLTAYRRPDIYSHSFDVD